MEDIDRAIKRMDRAVGKLSEGDGVSAVRRNWKKLSELLAGIDFTEAYVEEEDLLDLDLYSLNETPIRDSYLEEAVQAMNEPDDGSAIVDAESVIPL